MFSGKDILGFVFDLLTIFYLFLLNFFFTFKIFIKSYIMPKHFVQKSVKGDVVLITGAGKNLNKILFYLKYSTAYEFKEFRSLAKPEPKNFKISLLVFRGFNCKR